MSVNLYATRLYWDGRSGIARSIGTSVTLLAAPVLPGCVAVAEVDYAPEVFVAQLREHGAAMRDMSSDEITAAVALLATYASGAAGESKVWGVDANGVPLGLVARSDAYAVVGPPPAGDGWRWDFGATRWMRLVPLEEAIAVALDEIDRAAGAARCRYITDVAGQQGVYLRKYDQAKAFKSAGYLGDVPPYIAAEAVAIDGTAQQAADGILDTATLWDDQVSPAIERARIAGKRSVSAATTTAEVRTSAQAALDELDAI